MKMAVLYFVWLFKLSQMCVEKLSAYNVIILNNIFTKLFVA